MWVRTASEADLPAVHALLVEATRAAYSSILDPESVEDFVDSLHGPESLRRKLNSPFSEFVVADDGHGSVDGMAFAQQVSDDEAVLTHLYVRPSEQVKGLGTALLAEVEMAFPGVSTMILEVIDAQKDVVRFFENKGYVVTRRAGSSGNRKATVTMQKALETWAL